MAFEPCWMYHRVKGAKLITSQEEFDALKPGWAPTLAVFGIVTAPEEFQDDYIPEMDTHPEDDEVGDPKPKRRGRPAKGNE